MPSKPLTPSSTTIFIASTRATPAGGSRVKNLAEKITAIRERRERYKEMLAELDQTGECQISLWVEEALNLALKSC
jgi:hypothetical protein